MPHRDHHGARRLFARRRARRCRSRCAAADFHGLEPESVAPMTVTSARPVRPPHRRGSFRMLGVFVRTYPGRSSVALVSVFIASLFEGLGMSMLLSMLSLAGGSSTAPPSKPQQ